MMALPPFMHLRIFLPFALGYFLSYLYRTVNAVLAPDLVRDLNLDPARLGLLERATRRGGQIDDGAVRLDAVAWRRSTQLGDGRPPLRQGRRPLEPRASRRVKAPALRSR